MCVCMWAYVQECRYPRRPDKTPLELESQVVMIYPLWVLGTELRFPWGAVSSPELSSPVKSGFKDREWKARIADRRYPSRKASVRENSQHPSALMQSEERDHMRMMST